MQFIDTRCGAFRIYVGALESRLPEGGYTAALAITRVAVGGGDEQVFREDAVACGYRWPAAAQAMSYALARGRELVRRGQFDAQGLHTVDAAADHPAERAARDLSAKPLRAA